MDNDFVWDMLTKLARDGGCIVSSADCSVMEIADARVRGDFLVDNRGYGWVRRLPEWLQRHSRFARNASPDCCEGPQPAERGGRTVNDIPDSEHVERAVRNAGHWRSAAPRWVQVQHAFALGSTFAKQLCGRFGLDPDEEIGQPAERGGDE